MNINITVNSDLCNITSLAEQIQNRLSSALQKGAEVVASNARSMCPVDTGALRASISTSASGNSATVYAGEDYGIYVEMGTYKMAAQPFLTPALYSAEGAVLSEIAGGLGI